jgi:nucleoside-diphosphate-sugar epimerase
MRVALTGANGFLGRYVLGALRDRGIDTVLLGRTRPPDSSFAAFIEADLLATPDFPQLVQAASATHLVHLAWVTEHGAYWASPLNLRWLEGTIRLVEAFCVTGGQGVVVAGTCAEYDWSRGTCQEDSTPLNPSSLYGTAKDAARRLTAAICRQHQVTCAWGRVFLPYGAGEDKRRLIPSLIDAFQGKRQPFSVNTGALRDFLHASDVAEGFLTLLGAGADGAFNISSGQPTPLSQVVHQVARLLGADPQVILDLPARCSPGEPPLFVGENLKLRSLGWGPRLSLPGGLERTLREAREGP